MAVFDWLFGAGTFAKILIPAGVIGIFLSAPYESSGRWAVIAVGLPAILLLRSLYWLWRRSNFLHKIELAPLDLGLYKELNYIYKYNNKLFGEALEIVEWRLSKGEPRDETCWGTTGLSSTARRSPSDQRTS